MLTVPAKKRVPPASEYIYSVLEASNRDFRWIVNAIYSSDIPAVAPLKHLQSLAGIEDVFVRNSNSIVPKRISMVLPIEQLAASIASKIDARIYVLPFGAHLMDQVIG
jgi:hypothetical protein